MMQELSEEERYKERLFETMQDQGLVDNIKVKIRQKLIEKLQHQRKTKEVEPNALFVKKLCSSLFIDYLRANNLDYTLSVFSPECGFSSTLLLPDQLCSLLRLPKSGGSSLLQSLISTTLPRHTRTHFTTSTQVQTDDSSTVESLQLKLQFIEDSFKSKTHMNALLKVQQDQEGWMKYKTQLDKRYKEELDSQLKRVREFEIINVRMEERDRYNLMVKEIKEEFELSYKDKMAKLRDREQEVIQRVTHKMKQIEDFNHQNRQKVLKDLEMIKQKEAELERYRLMLEQKEKALSKQQ